MKEVAYRAYYANQIYKVKAIDFNHKKVNLNGGDIISLKDIELLPYIGIKDIHKNKVFQGHVVKVRQTIYEDCSREEIDEVREYIGEIVWWQFTWNIAIKSEHGLSYKTLWLWDIHGEGDDTMEIIGNRWNNPEIAVIE